MARRPQEPQEHQGRPDDDRGVREVEDGPTELVPAQFEKIPRPPRGENDL
jgi:hypothetical protein